MSGAWDALAGGFAAAAMRSATPLLLALVGETVRQRAGVIDLGTEGEMLVGAAAAFAVTSTSGSPALGLAVGAVAGGALSLLHALLCVRLRCNQFASGLCVAMLGYGLSAFAGAGFVGQSIDTFAPVRWFGTPTVALALAAVPASAVALAWTRFGLALRAVGESTEAARASGLRVEWLQTVAVGIGGLAAGAGGAALSIDYAQTWAEGMTRGRGLVAVGLVIVARWNPVLTLPAALLFGGAEALALRVQSTGATASSHLLHMLPYATSLGVFILTCLRRRGAATGAPAGLAAVLNR